MLKLFYTCYFVVVGVSTAFFGPYLRRLGLSGREMSAILSVAPALQLGVPLMWGWVADRSRRTDWVMRVLCLGACLTSVPIAFSRSMPALLWLYLAEQFFAGSITALGDAIAIETAKASRRDYAATRVWGSLSFIVTCLLVGAALDARAVPNGDVLVPALVTVGFGLSFLASLGLKGNATWEAPRLRDVTLLLRNARFRFLLLVASLHWFGLTPFHGFFGVSLQDRGMPATTTSHAFIVGSCAEIIVFMGYAKLRSRCSLSALFAASFLVTALHWVVIAYTRSAVLIVLTQLLHGMTFGLFWATSMAWIGECIPSELRATGQMLFSTTLGVGAMVGLLAVGALYDATGGAGAAFFIAGALELAPMALALGHWYRHKGKSVQAPPSG